LPQDTTRIGPTHHSSQTTRSSKFTTNRVMDRMSGVSTMGAIVRSAEESPSWFTLHPASRPRLCFDACSIIILVTDLTMIPYIIAFEVPHEGFVAAFSWFTVVFWTLDICVNFITGYNSEGEVELSLNKIARTYLRGWFLLDFTIVVCDWVSTLVTGMSSGADESADGFQFLYFGKISRLFRMAGILRVLRLARILEEHIDRFMPGGSVVAIRLCSTLVILIWLNHVLGCFWYAIGKQLPSDTGMSWLQTDIVIGHQSYEYQELSMWYQYATAVHWSMAQMTLGANEIVASSTWERVANITLLLVGLLFSSSLVSSFSATLIGLQMQTNHKTEAMRALRQFLRQNAVDGKLSLRITKQIDLKIQKASRLEEEDVKALALLSQSLRLELRYSIFSSHLLHHPVFRFINDESLDVMRSFCMDSVGFKLLQKGDDLFGAGNSSEEAYNLIAGQLRYSQYPETSVCSVAKHTHVLQGRWLAEAALWTHWIHVGCAEATLPSEILVVSADGLAKVLLKHRILLEVIAEYGKKYHGRVTSARPPGAWPTDLHVPYSDFEDIVMSMEHNSRMSIGLRALQPSQGAYWSSSVKEAASELEKEVIEGRSVVMNITGEPIRVVSLVAFKVQRENGDVLVQLGKATKQTKTASCKLPGGTVDMDELPREAADRVLQSKFGAIADQVVITSSDREEWFADSKRWKLRSKYIRTVCHSRVQEPILLPYAVVPETEGPSVLKAGHLLKTLAVREAFAFERANGDIVYLAWITPLELEEYQKPEGEKAILAWLASVQIMPTEVAREPNERRQWLRENRSLYRTNSMLIEEPFSWLQTLRSSLQKIRTSKIVD